MDLNNGDKISYEKLCVCTGAFPKVIFPGHPHVLYIRDTESVQTFMSRISSAKRIVIVGNGGIATEMVYEISGQFFLHMLKLFSEINSYFSSSFCCGEIEFNDIFQLFLKIKTNYKVVINLFLLFSHL